MLVYRAMSLNEVLHFVNGKNFDFKNFKGDNTFNYVEGKKYIHFFKFPEHAFWFKKHFWRDIVAEVKMDDVQTYEYGFYPEFPNRADLGAKMLLPEIILETDSFDKKQILDFSLKSSGKFSRDENGELTRFSVFNNDTYQIWSGSDVYYEYVKSLLPKFNYDTLEVAMYLKSINLDEELAKMTKYIKRTRLITKKEN